MPRSIWLTRKGLLWSSRTARSMRRRRQRAARSQPVPAPRRSPLAVVAQLRPVGEPSQCITCCCGSLQPAEVPGPLRSAPERAPIIWSCPQPPYLVASQVTAHPIRLPKAAHRDRNLHSLGCCILNSPMRPGISTHVASRSVLTRTPRRAPAIAPAPSRSSPRGIPSTTPTAPPSAIAAWFRDTGTAAAAPAHLHSGAIGAGRATSRLSLISPDRVNASRPWTRSSALSSPPR